MGLRVHAAADMRKVLECGEVVCLWRSWGCVFGGVAAVSGEIAVYSGGVRGLHLGPPPAAPTGWGGLKGEVGYPSEEVKGRVLAFAATWGLSAAGTPLLGWEGGACPPSDPLVGVLRPAVHLYQPVPGQAGGAEPPPRSPGLGGGVRQRIPAHPSAFRWSRQEPPQSCLEGIAVFEETQAGGWGLCRENSPPGGSSENH